MTKACGALAGLRERAVVGLKVSKGERSSFLKKRSKKLLCLQAGAGERSATAIKSFLVLFFKKELLSSHGARFVHIFLPSS
jgi:hypothetical protein